MGLFMRNEIDSFSTVFDIQTAAHIFVKVAASLTNFYPSHAFPQFLDNPSQDHFQNARF
jgi:hypothetical protein